VIPALASTAAISAGTPREVNVTPGMPSWLSRSLQAASVVSMGKADKKNRP
jgi:hypothetical protein